MTLTMHEVARGPAAPSPDSVKADDVALSAVFDRDLDTYRESLAAARRTAQEHFPRGGMCTCFRPLPCGVRAVLEQRRADFEASIAALLGPTTLIPTVTPDPANLPSARPAGRSWWRLRRGGRRQSRGRSA